MEPLRLVMIVALVSASASFAQSERPIRVKALIGGYGALTGSSDYGAAGVVALSPGGRFGRVGLRGSARSFEGLERGFLAAGVSFEAGAARPRLVLSLFAEAGIASGSIPVAGGGIQTLVGVVGPLAVALETGIHLFVDGSNSELAITGALLIGLSL